MLRDKGIRGKKAHMHSQQNKEGILDSYSPRACLQVVTWSQRFLQPPSSAPPSRIPRAFGRRLGRPWLFVRWGEASLYS